MVNNILVPFQVHERSHTGDRPFKCEFQDCGKAFATGYGLKSHTRVHTGEKPYRCGEDGCDKAFKTSGDLQKHVRTHTGMHITGGGGNLTGVGRMGMSNLLPYLSLVVRKPVFGVSDQVRHKLGCAVTADDWRLENSDLGRGGIVLSM